MVYIGSIIKVVDNSGARFVECIKILKKSSKSQAFIGDILVVSVKKAVPHKKVNKGEIFKGVLVKQKKKIFRYSGYFLSFETNGIVLLTNNLNLVGTRILTPVAAELRRKNFSRILSLSPAVI